MSVLNREWPLFAVFALAIVAQQACAFALPEIQTRAQILIYVSTALLPLAVLLLILRRRSNLPIWLLGFLFALFAAVDLFIDPFGSELISSSKISGLLPMSFSQRSEFDSFISRALFAWDGWLVPGVIVGIFICFYVGIKRWKGKRSP